MKKSKHKKSESKVSEHTQSQGELDKSTLTEAEKMARGEWYFASDKTLAQQRMHAKTLCFELNHTQPSDVKARQRIQKRLLPNVKSAWIEPHFYCDYGVNIHAQQALFINHNVSVLDGAEVIIGEHVFIGPGCVIACTSHHMDSTERARGLCRSKPIIIGNKVWLGANVTILGGAVIEDNTVIPAGSVIK